MYKRQEISYDVGWNGLEVGEVGGAVWVFQDPVLQDTDDDHVRVDGTRNGFVFDVDEITLGRCTSDLGFDECPD